jgi:hypothetical protein
MDPFKRFLSVSIRSYGDVFTGLFFTRVHSVLNGFDLKFLFLDRIYRIMGVFFRLAAGYLSGRRPSYPFDPVNPV